MVSNSRIRLGSATATAVPSMETMNRLRLAAAKMGYWRTRKFLRLTGPSHGLPALELQSNGESGRRLKVIPPLALPSEARQGELGSG